MSTQKERWAAKAEKYEGWAFAADTEAERLETRQPHESDVAFLTQPGRLPARDRMYRRLERAGELRDKAKSHRNKAKSLRAMASRNKGDAERRREIARSADVNVGDMVTSMFGTHRVTKVNRKTVRLEGLSTVVDRAFIRKMAEANQ